LKFVPRVALGNLFGGIGLMPEFKTEVLHGLGQDVAVDRLKGFVERVQDRFRDQLDKADGAWADNVLDFSLSASGISIQGKLTVDETRAHVAGRLPLLAVPLRGMIERQIAQELQSALT
jgi:hypothetical protein